MEEISSGVPRRHGKGPTTDQSTSGTALVDDIEEDDNEDDNEDNSQFEAGESQEDGDDESDEE